MGTEVSDELIQNIDSLCQFDAMKKDKNAVKDVTEWRDNNPSGMYRKGERERERELNQLKKEIMDVI